MLKATKKWHCGVCEVAINPGDSFDIVKGVFKCAKCIKKSQSESSKNKEDDNE